MSWLSKAVGSVGKAVGGIVNSAVGLGKKWLDPFGWVFKDEKLSSDSQKPPVEAKEVETVEASVDADSLLEDKKNRKKGFSSTIKSNAYGGFLGGAIGGGKSALGD